MLKIIVIFSEDGTVWRELARGGGVYFTFDEIFTEDLPVNGRVYFMEGEPDLSALFEKQSEIK